MVRPGRIALIGDLHGSWDDWDVAYFNDSDYDLLLFTGDLGRSFGTSGVRVARSIARLAKPALVMPGNNDVQHHPAIAAELAYQRGLIEILAAGPRERSRSLARSSGRVELCGYSQHPLSLGGRALTLVAGRPHARGGGELSFAEHLERNHGVATMDESAERLRSLVAQAPGDDLILFAHNGPTGLGGDPTDPWGCDFLEGAGDWGDPDLAAALEEAQSRGKNVLAVIAGHMHLATKSGEERVSQRERGGTLYLNPARVPRIEGGREGTRRAHFCLEVDGDGLRAREVFASSGP